MLCYGAAKLQPEAHMSGDLVVHIFVHPYAKHLDMVSHAGNLTLRRQSRWGEGVPGLTDQAA